MRTIQHLSTAIGENYKTNTGRHLKVIPDELGGEFKRGETVKVALYGDSTIDQGHWVDKGISYADKTHTVTYQTAYSLMESAFTTDTLYELANFSVDGAQTKDLLSPNGMELDEAVADPDHDCLRVNQLQSGGEFKAHVSILSVGGNDYRVPLQHHLPGLFGIDVTVMTGHTPIFSRAGLTTIKNFAFRVLPRLRQSEDTRGQIRNLFSDAKRDLLANYKQIIDRIIADNQSSCHRLVLVSQYYPAITVLTIYFIYTGFSYIASAFGKTDGFTYMQELMEEVYSDIMTYVSNKASVNKDLDVVFVDMSSLNPLGGNHSRQIEPNENGAAKIGKLLAAAVTHTFAPDEPKKKLIKLNSQGQIIKEEFPEMNDGQCKYSATPIAQFIRENRYRHLFPSRHTHFAERLINTYFFYVGNRFDADYSGWFAYGLLDVSLVTVLAAYLWRYAKRSNAADGCFIKGTRLLAGVISVPILFIQAVIGLMLTLVTMRVLYILHRLIYKPVTDSPASLDASEISARRSQLSFWSQFAPGHKSAVVVETAIAGVSAGLIATGVAATVHSSAAVIGSAHLLLTVMGVGGIATGLGAVAIASGGIALAALALIYVGYKIYQCCAATSDDKDTNAGAPLLSAD